jgi:hypothetical protein
MENRDGAYDVPSDSIGATTGTGAGAGRGDGASEPAREDSGKCITGGPSELTGEAALGDGAGEGEGELPVDGTGEGEGEFPVDGVGTLGFESEPASQNSMEERGGSHRTPRAMQRTQSPRPVGFGSQMRRTFLQLTH